MFEQPGVSRIRTLTTFRIHLLLTCLGVTAAFALVVALAVFVPLAAQLQRVPVDFESTAGLADHFLFLHSALWPLVLLSLLSCVVAATLLFERMRSPLVRFARCFDAISEGSIPEPLMIRKQDYLVDEAAQLNRMIGFLRERAEADKRVGDRLLDLLGDLSEAGVDPAILEELQAIAKSGHHAAGPVRLRDRRDA
jgi:hypothetical protein